MIEGVDVDASGRCAHWNTALDIVAFRFPCCDQTWACRDCHDELADHAVRPIESHDLAIQCGNCRSLLTASFYRECGDACPHCGAAWNPKCRDHEDRYFA